MKLLSVWVRVKFCGDTATLRLSMTAFVLHGHQTPDGLEGPRSPVSKLSLTAELAAEIRAGYTL